MRLGYGVEIEAGAKPSAFIWLPRANNIGGIDLTTETIDASALEDMIERAIAGRQGTGGEWEFTFNLTNETQKIYAKMLKDANDGLASNYRTWFEVWSPYLDSAFFIVAQPGGKLPMSEIAQNELLTCALTLALDEYVGLESEGVVKPELGDLGED